MSVNRSYTEEKPPVPMPVVIGAVLLLVLFIGFVAYVNLVPKRPDTGVAEESKNDWVAQLAKETGGDINKVDPQTRQKLDIFTGGKGAELLKSKFESSKR